MIFSRLKYPDLHCCLAKTTGLRCFIVSQHIIKFTDFHGQFLFKKLPLARGVQAAFLEIKSSLKPNQVVKNFSSQASNQIAVPKNCQIKPQIKSGSSNFHQIKSQIKPPAYEFCQIKSQIKSQPQNFRQIKSQIT